MTTTQPSMLTSSVISFPERGPDGRSNYRGNTSGKVVEAFLRMFHRPSRCLGQPEGGGRRRGDDLHPRGGRPCVLGGGCVWKTLVDLRGAGVQPAPPLAQSQ